MAEFFTQRVIKPYLLQPELENGPAGHFVYTPVPSRALGQLLVFLGGTTSKPANYQTFPAWAARVGYHVINLAYPTEVSSLSCEQEEDLASFTRYRHQMLTGHPAGDATPTAGSLLGRTQALLAHLATEQPQGGWETFFASGTLHHPHLTLVGHSQGAGHAAYWAQRYAVQRVIVLAGPNDTSLRHSTPAPWLSEAFATPKERFYGVLHHDDEVVDYHRQRAVWEAMGLVAPGAIPEVGLTTPAEAYTPFMILTDEPIPDQIGIAQKHSLMVADGRAARMGHELPPYRRLWEYWLGVE